MDVSANVFLSHVWFCYLSLLCLWYGSVYYFQTQQRIVLLALLIFDFWTAKICTTTNIIKYCQIHVYLLQIKLNSLLLPQRKCLHRVVIFLFPVSLGCLKCKDDLCCLYKWDCHDFGLISWLWCVCVLSLVHVCCWDGFCFDSLPCVHCLHDSPPRRYLIY